MSLAVVRTDLPTKRHPGWSDADWAAVCEYRESFRRNASLFVEDFWQRRIVASHEVGVHEACTSGREEGLLADLDSRCAGADSAAQFRELCRTLGIESDKERMDRWVAQGPVCRAIACRAQSSDKSLFVSLYCAKTEANTFAPDRFWGDVITAMYIPFGDADTPDRVTIYDDMMKELAQWTRRQGQLFGHESDPDQDQPADLPDVPGMEPRDDLYRLLETSRLPMAPFRHDCSATLQWRGRSWQRCVFMQPCMPLTAWGLSVAFDRDTEVLLELGFISIQERYGLHRIWGGGAPFWMEAADEGPALLRLALNRMIRINSTD